MEFRLYPGGGEGGGFSLSLVSACSVSGVRASREVFFCGIVYVYVQQACIAKLSFRSGAGGEVDEDCLLSLPDRQTDGRKRISQRLGVRGGVSHKEALHVWNLVSTNPHS